MSDRIERIATTAAYDWGYDDSDGTDETCFVLGRKTDRGFEILAQVYGDGGKHLAAYIERLEAERTKYAALVEAAKIMAEEFKELVEDNEAHANDLYLGTHDVRAALADLEADHE